MHLPSRPEAGFAGREARSGRSVSNGKKGAGGGNMVSPALLAVNRGDDRDDQDGDDVGDLEHRVDRGASGVLVGIAHRVARDGGRMGLRTLAAERAVLDRLLRVVPGASARG